MNFHPAQGIFPVLHGTVLLKTTVWSFVVRATTSTKQTTQSVFTGCQQTAPGPFAFCANNYRNTRPHVICCCVSTGPMQRACVTHNSRSSGQLHSRKLPVTGKHGPTVPELQRSKRSQGPTGKPRRRNGCRLPPALNTSDDGSTTVRPTGPAWPKQL